MRRLRALAVISALWAVIFAPVAVLTSAQYWLTHHRPLPLGFVLQMLLIGAIFGAVSGAIFGLVLMLAERRRTVEKLRLPRLLLWGAIGGLIPEAVQAIGVFVRFPGVWNVSGSHQMFLTIFTYGFVQGVAAAGITFAIARRGRPSIAAPGPDPLLAG